jgi:hypothetical protein
MMEAEKKKKEEETREYSSPQGYDAFSEVRSVIAGILDRCKEAGCLPHEIMEELASASVEFEELGDGQLYSDACTFAADVCANDPEVFSQAFDDYMGNLESGKKARSDTLETLEEVNEALIQEAEELANEVAKEEEDIRKGAP